MTNKEVLLATLRGDPVTGAQRLPIVASDAKNLRLPFERATDPKKGYDWFGVHWTRSGPDMTPTPGGHVLESISDWKGQVRFPDLSMYDIESYALRDLEGLDRENTVLCVTLLNGHFERLHSLMGFENALMAFYDDPDALHEFFEAFTAHRMRTFDLVQELYRPDYFCVHDDWGTSLNMFFNPELWREFIKPHVKRLIDHVHGMGLIYSQHSCGFIAPIIEDLCEIGCDSVELQGINPMAELAEQCGGRITFVGGMDGQKLTAPGCPPDVIRDAIRENFELLAPTGRYVVHMPPELRRDWNDQIMACSAEFCTAAV